MSRCAVAVMDLVSSPNRVSASLLPKGAGGQTFNVEILMTGREQEAAGGELLTMELGRNIVSSSGSGGRSRARGTLLECLFKNPVPSLNLGNKQGLVEGRFRFLFFCNSSELRLDNCGSVFLSRSPPRQVVPLFFVTRSNTR